MDYLIDGSGPSLAFEFDAPARENRVANDSLLLYYTQALRSRIERMETVLDDIKELGRETAASNRKLVRRLTHKELDEKISALRQSLLTASGEAIAFFRVTEVLTRRMSTKLATAVWKETRQRLIEIEKGWMSMPKSGRPELDDTLARYCEVLRDLTTKADQEYRSYAETAHLLASPTNAKRLKEAIADTRKGKVKRWPSVTELIKSKRG